MGMESHSLWPLWLPSLGIIFLMSVHVVAGVSAPFLLMAESYSAVWTDHNWFMQVSAGGHLGSFYLLEIVNSAAMHICV